MAGIIAPDVVRYTIEGSIFGQPADVVLCMVVQDITGPRHTAIEHVANVLVTQWHDFIQNAGMSSQYTVQKVSWVDLDSETGSTGETSAGTGASAPYAGAVGGDCCPANVAMEVVKAINAVRGVHHGKSYVPGVPESGQANGLLTSSMQTAAQTAADAFLTAVTDTGEGADPAFFMTVLHTHHGLYVDNHQVQHYNVQQKLRSQRRRIGK